MADEEGRTDAPFGKERKPRILWAARSCVLDASSGAARTVREMLRQLAMLGCEVQTLGATIFDSESAAAPVLEAFPENHLMVAIDDAPLVHRLVRTRTWRSGDMSDDDVTIWMAAYLQELEAFQPDVVMYFGGRPVDWLIPGEAKRAGIATAAYVANGSYHGARWCRDTDLLFTTTRAGADMYKARDGLSLQPVGLFVDPATARTESSTRTHITFVTARLEKGAALVAQVALALEERRPDIRFDIVEGRGNWSEILGQVSASTGTRCESLANCDVTPLAPDMRALFRRSRLLFVPSLWWENAARVVVEAQFNGIPALATKRGGLPEIIGAGGCLVDLPQTFFDAPYNSLLTEEGVAKIADLIVGLFDDEDAYNALAARAQTHAATAHAISDSAARLAQHIAKIIPCRAT